MCQTSASDQRSIEDTKAYLKSLKPHTYEPKQIGSNIACAKCGVGPGAFVHNDYEVERFQKEQSAAK